MGGDRRPDLGRLWPWPVAVLVGFPIGGFLADLVVDGVDSVGTALAGGAIAGAVVGTAQWLALRRWVPWHWIVATVGGFALGLAMGAAIADYGISRGDLLVIGACTGLGVGAVQAYVLGGQGIPGAYWWAIANPPAWALGWLVTSYVISSNVDERFTNFGAGGALVYGLLTWLLLAVLLPETEPDPEPDPELDPEPDPAG